VSGQLEGIEEILESQLNIKNQIMNNVDDKLYIDGVQRIEAVFIAFLKSKFIFTIYVHKTYYLVLVIRLFIFFIMQNFSISCSVQKTSHKIMLKEKVQG
jgi:hypothetical protein